ncbi:MAG TPA: hypothetical protein VKX17_25185 [Planctomycetota bacterium]|nr:hypothetical protein [Planctomycetota bacterium]
MSHPVIFAAEEALNCRLDSLGNLALLDGPRRALLISRAERNPTPATPWIRDTIAATNALIAAGETLVAGTNRTAWDVALLTCKAKGGAAIVALEDQPRGIVDPQLVPGNALTVWPSDSEALDKSGRLLRRDSLVALLADRAWTICVRESGNMSMAAELLRARGCPVENWIDRAAVKADDDASRKIDESTAPNEIKSAPDFSFAGRLTHFTREPDRLWPGELPVERLRWLCSGPNFEPRDGFQALRRILSEKKLRACSKLIPSSQPMVCFTARDPIALLAENRWRKGLRRWTYSPYALSFLSEDLCTLGAASVRYVSREEMQATPVKARGFCQIKESSGIDWAREMEWRVSGDVDFSRIEPARIVALVARADEARRIEDEFGIRALAIGHRAI